MIRARMFAIACGCEDCDDLDVVRFNPAFKLAPIPHELKLILLSFLAMRLSSSNDCE